MNERSPSLFGRLWLAFVTWFRIVFDAPFAGKVQRLAGPSPEAPPAPDTRAATGAETKQGPPASAETAVDGALMLLGMLQRDGRFVDFVQQDITTFGDADVGAAARVVHEGCRRVLARQATIVRIRPEAEGVSLSLDAAEAERVKLVGEVGGKPPYRGVLRHAGWRCERFELPKRVGTQDPKVVAEAEVELG